MVVFDKFDGCQKVADGVVLLPAGFIAETKIVVGFVGSRIEAQHPLQLADRVINATFLIIDPAQHVGAFVVGRASLQQVDERALGSIDVPQEVFGIAFDLQRGRLAWLRLQDLFHFPFRLREALCHQVDVCQSDPP